MSELNIEKLIQAISTENPSGMDLRQNTSADSLYYRIKDARNVARDLERQQSMGALEGASDERPRWDKLLALCIEALTHHTKDLEIVSFLIEALVREQGFEGLAQGFEITQKLIELYWETLYPLPDEEGFEIRLSALNSLNGEDYEGTLIRPLYHLPITQGNSVGPFALWQYQQAIENSKLQDKEVIERRLAQGSTFIQEIKIAISESKPAFYEKLIDSIINSKNVLQSLNAAIESQCTEQSFSISQISNALDFFREHVTYLLKEAPFAVKLSPDQNLENVQEGSLELSEAERAEALKDSERFFQKNISVEGNLNNREEALLMLKKVAAFFRLSEPQSPMPYLLERSIRLGGLSFPELFKALVNDEGARRFCYELLGVEG